VLVYQEHFGSLAEARQRERQLKSWKSHRSIQELNTSYEEATGERVPACREGRRSIPTRSTKFSVMHPVYIVSTQKLI